MCIGKTASKAGIVVHNVRSLSNHDLGPPVVPERHSAVQAGENIIDPRPCVSVLQPAQLNNPPQLVAESESFRRLRFLRPNPFHDRVDGQNVRRELEVRMVSAQDLEYHR